MVVYLCIAVTAALLVITLDNRKRMKEMQQRILDQDKELSQYKEECNRCLQELKEQGTAHAEAWSATELGILRRLSQMNEQATKTAGQVNERLDGLDERLKVLEDGGSPDYEKAKQAARAMDDFHSGISAIMNFDPHQVLKAQREDRTGGDGH